mgnify:FL=1
MTTPRYGYESIIPGKRYRTPEAAAILDMNAEVLRRWMRSTRIEAFQDIAGDWFILGTELQRLWRGERK